MRCKKIQMLIFALILGISCFFGGFSSIEFATATETNGNSYSNVLTDLQKDENFDISNYPVNQEDYSLNVITIAESTDKELFVYVYQPSADLLATSINISTAEKNLDFVNYKLALINSNGTLYKYLVTDFVILDSQIRFYEITSIYRVWNSNYDEDIDNDNTINYVNFDVCKQWIFTTTDTGLEISMKDIETIDITSKYVGFVRYEQGSYSQQAGPYRFNYLLPGMDSHFVAFSTDKEIDKVLEADVYFQTQSYSAVRVAGSLTLLQKTDFDEEFGDITSNYSYLNDEQVVDATAGNHRYVYERIQSVEDFIENENYEYIYNGVIFDRTTETQLTEESKSDLQGKQWVLRFYESEYSDSISKNPITGASLVTESVVKTLVSNVSILRLTFETDGVVYNLGVLDNAQTSDGIPDNVTTTTWSLSKLAKLTLIIALIILVVIVMIPVWPYIFKGIWVCISAPFKWIAQAIENGKN